MSQSTILKVITDVLFKVVAAVFVTLLCHSVNGQVVVDSISGEIRLDQVREIDLNKSEIRDKVSKWVAVSYNNSNYVTRVNTDDNIVTKGLFVIGYDVHSFGTSVHVSIKVGYTLDMKFKDGRYKVEIYGLEFNGEDAKKQLSAYFMNYEDYRKYCLINADNYEGAGKAAMVKRINNDEKFTKDYMDHLEYGKKVVSQVIDNLNVIELGVFEHVKKAMKEVDW